jgi:hypothetical protein
MVAMKTECKSECDCDATEGHDPRCHSRQTCDDEKYCDKHLDETLRGWRKHFGNPNNRPVSPDQFLRDLVDAGRGHLVAEYMADRADYLKDIEKEKGL